MKTWIPAYAGMTDEQFTVEKLIQRITQYASCRPVRIDPVSDQTPVVGDELVVFMGRELFTHNALQDAMQEIRNISRGLRLPDIEKLGVTDIIAQVCAAHSARTESAVEQDLFAGDIPATYSVKITTYRFVQETLNNAFLHAGGRDQRVGCHYDVDRLLLTISVSDGGPGINRQSSAKGVRGLGLPGLQERIESIGGTFEIMTGKNAGTTVKMTVPIGREV